MELDHLKRAIVYHMIKELSTVKYGYQTIIEGCFDASQRYGTLQVPAEHVLQMRKECVEEVLTALKKLSYT